MIKKVIKKTTARKSSGTQIPPKVSGSKQTIDKTRNTDAYIADKILDAARKGGLSTKKHINSATFSKENPGPKRMSRRDEAMQIVGASNMTRVMELIRDQALAGVWDCQKYLADLFYPKGKPDKYISRAIDEMIEIHGLKDYQDNIAIVVSLAMKGELDLDDSAVIIAMLKEGKDFNAINTMTEMEERLKVLNAMAPARK